MGLPNFHNYLEKECPECFKIGVLRDTEVVIDGNSFVHFLYENKEISCAFGGEYDVFAEKIEEYLNNFKACSIKAHVVFDGGFQLEDNCYDFKFEKQRKRLKTRLEDVQKVMDKVKDSFAIPLNAFEVFREVLKNKKVNFVQCAYECDSQLAGLAYDLSCPLLSQDSDFYMYDLPKGVIKLSSLTYNKDKTFSCKTYFAEKFCEHFPKDSEKRKVDKAMLPMFGTLLLHKDFNFVREAVQSLYYAIVQSKSPLQTQAWKNERFNEVAFCVMHRSSCEIIDEVLKHITDDTLKDIFTSYKCKCLDQLLTDIKNKICVEKSMHVEEETFNKILQNMLEDKRPLKVHIEQVFKDVEDNIVNKLYQGDDVKNVDKIFMDIEEKVSHETIQTVMKEIFCKESMNLKFIDQFSAKVKSMFENVVDAKSNPSCEWTKKILMLAESEIVSSMQIVLPQKVPDVIKIRNKCTMQDIKVVMNKIKENINSILRNQTINSSSKKDVIKSMLNALKQEIQEKLKTLVREILNIVLKDILKGNFDDALKLSKEKILDEEMQNFNEKHKDEARSLMKNSLEETIKSYELERGKLKTIVDFKSEEQRRRKKGKNRKSQSDTRMSFNIKAPCCKTELPRKFVNRYHKGHIHSFLLNVITLNRQVLHPQVGHLTESTYHHSMDIRKIIYTILSKHNNSEIFCFKTVHELSRRQETQSTHSVEVNTPIEINSNDVARFYPDSSVLSLANLYSKKKEELQEFLRNVMGVNKNFFADIDEDLKLYFGSVNYYLKKLSETENDDLKKPFLNAILVCAIYLKFKSLKIKSETTQRSPSTSSSTHGSYEDGDFDSDSNKNEGGCIFNTEENIMSFDQIPKDEFDAYIHKELGNLSPEILHCLSEFQSCFLYMSCLNSLANNPPFKSHRLHDTFSGSMLHSLMAKGIRESTVEQMLHRAPNICDLFKKLRKKFEPALSKRRHPDSVVWERRVEQRTGLSSKLLEK